MVRKYLSHLRLTVARLIAWILFRGPTIVNAGRHRLLFDPASGRLMPLVAGGEGDDDDSGSENDDDDKSGSENDDDDDTTGDTGKGSGDDDATGDKPPGDDASADEWKAYARKWESRAKRGGRRRGGRDRETPALKRERERAEQAERELNDLKDKDKTEQQKAIDKAREEARSEVLTEAQKERRDDRLELEVTRLATRGMKIEVEKDGSVTEETVRFADPDDALARLERAIRRGDIEADLFDDNDRVQTDELATALTELLEDNPHLREGAKSNGGGRQGKGDADAGKGKGKSSGATSVDDEFQAIRRNK